MTKKPSTPRTHSFTPVDAPPPAKTAGRPGGAYIPVFDYCRENPGQWVKMDRRFHVSLAHNIATGAVKGAAKGEFKVVTRNRGTDSKCDIYICYVGQHSGGPQS
jgi:hypothetical protein